MGEAGRVNKALETGKLVLGYQQLEKASGRLD